MWLLSGRCTCTARLDGKTAVITGANCGIGKATALDLVRRGARVILACRDLKKAEEASQDIRDELKGAEGVGEVLVVKMDLSSLESVRECARLLLQTESKIHILINNAGVSFGPKELTKDGFELHIGVNHLGHFLFTCLLLPRIIRSAPARIITVASVINILPRTLKLNDLAWEKRSFSTVYGYGESKLANVLFSAELGKRLRDTGVTTYSLHPGLVVTNSARHANNTFFWGAKWLWEQIGYYLFKTTEQGAQTSIHCAVAESLAKETGQYYSDCKKSTASSLVKNTLLRENLWEESARQVGLDDWDPFTAEDTGSIPEFVPPPKSSRSLTSRDVLRDWTNAFVKQ